MFGNQRLVDLNLRHFSMAKMTVTEASRWILGGKSVKGVVFTAEVEASDTEKACVFRVDEKANGETEFAIERISPSLTPACDAVLSAIAFARFKAAAYAFAWSA